MFATGVIRTADEINSAMARVYANMGIAVLISMLVSYTVGNSAAAMAVLFGTPLVWVVIFAPLVAVLIASWAHDKFTKGGLRLFLWGFSALMGLSMASIFVVYNLGSIFSAFMGAAVLFAVMSGYGYFTKRDLTSMGSLFMVGLIAIIIASIINIFVGSTVLQMVISAIGVIVFLGLTAYDTQKTRELVTYDNDGRAEIWAAMNLYLDFINLFMFLLQLFGQRKN